MISGNGELENSINVAPGFPTKNLAANEVITTAEVAF